MSTTGRIIKSKAKTEFTIVPNDVLRDNNLSLKAKGLLALLLSFPPDWKVYKSTLTDYAKDGRDGVNNAFQELEDLGFVQKQENRDGGRFNGYDYTVSAEPVFATEKTPQAEKPQRGNRNGKSDTTKKGFTNKEGEANASNNTNTGKRGNRKKTEPEKQTFDTTTEFGKFQVWLKANAARVQLLQEPLNEEKYLKLRGKFPLETIMDVLENMHNMKDLLKKYVSAYVTCSNWCNRRVGEIKPTNGQVFKKREDGRTLKNLSLHEGENSRFTHWYDTATHPLWAVADQFGNINYSKAGLKQAVSVSRYEDVKHMFPANIGITRHGEYANDLFAVFADNTIQPLGLMQRRNHETQGANYKPQSIRKGIIA